MEMDPWVVSSVLRPNLEWTGFVDVSTVHMVRVERFLEQARQAPGEIERRIYSFRWTW